MAVTASALLVLALCSVAAGATQNATPKKWISVMCGSTLVLEQTITRNVNKLSKSLSTTKHGQTPSVPTRKRELVSYLSAIVRATAATTAKIRSVGPPKMTNGSKLQSGVLSGFGVVRSGFQQALNVARKLPTTSAKQFSTGALALAKTLQADVNRIRAAFLPVERYSTKALSDAARQDPACKKLANA